MKGIAFEGGGVTGIAHAGALQFIEERNMLNDFTHFSGSSVGGIVAVVMACRTNPGDMKKILFESNFNDLKDNSWFAFKDVYRFVNEYGWNRTGNLRDWLENILKEGEVSKDITFKEMNDTYDSFPIITTTDVNNGNTVYYNPENNPEMSVVEAMVRSCAYPGFFTPIVENGVYYADGGILDNYPIRSLYKYLDENEVMGIKLVNKELKEGPQETCNVKDYYVSMLKIIRDQALRYHVKEEDKKRSIFVDVGSVGSMDFDITDEQKEILYTSGYEAAKKHLKVI